MFFGATSGIGRGLAIKLAEDGYQVMITGRREERLEELKATKPEAFLVRRHDITDLEDSDKLFDQLQQTLGEVDLIIHNSGIGQDNFDLTWDKDLPTLKTNVLGAAKVYQRAYNFFKEQGRGHLVSITSIASLTGNRHVPAYHASKSFQSSYMESLWMKAQKTKKAKIDVTEILPGYIDTDIITGETFWMAPLDKGVAQIYRAIQKKKRRAYITKRWALIAFLLRVLPARVVLKFF